LHQDKGQSRHRGKKEGSMTPQEAAAECRERSDKAKQEIKRRGCKPGTAEHYVLETEHEAWNDAAMLIDQIGKPIPWPPPEEMEEALAFCTSFNEKKWMNVGRKHQQAWTDMDLMIAYRPTHYLPMPPAPEVKG